MGEFDIYRSAINGLALIASGSTTKEGPYKKDLERAKGFLIKQINKAFELAAKEPDHGLVAYYPFEFSMSAIFLAHLYQASRSDDLKDILEKLRDCFIRLQCKDGGWSYWNKKTTMTYMTTPVLMALFILDHAGIKVDEKVFELARKHYAEILQRRQDGMFYYFAKPEKTFDKSDNHSGLGRTMGALLPMYLLGLTKTEIFTKTKTYCEKHLEDLDRSSNGPSFHLFWGGLSLFYTDENGWKNYWNNFGGKITNSQDKHGGILIKHRDNAYKPIDGRPGINSYAGTDYTTGHYAIILQLVKGHLLFDKLKPLALEDKKD